MRARILLYSLPVVLLAIAVLVYHKRGMTKNEAITARIILYKTANQLIREKPLIGHGPGNFVVSANSYLSGLKRKSYSDSLYKLRPVIRYAGKVHNEYLEIAVEEGIPGVIAFMLFILFSLRGSLTRDDGILSGILPGVCAVLVHSVVSFPLRSPVPGALFFVMLGLVAPGGRTRVLRIPRLAKILILPCAAVGVFWIVKPLIADCYFAQGKRLGKIELLEKSARWYPVSQELYFNLSRDYMRKGRYEDAISSGEKAVDIQPFHEIAHFQLGCAYEGLNDEIRATEEYRRAIFLNPELFVACSRLSELYLRQGKKNLARSVLKTALTYRDSVACLHNSLGLVWMHLENREKAVEDFSISMSTLKRNLVAICNKHTAESQGGTNGLIDGKAYEWINTGMTRGTDALLRSEFSAAKSVFNEILTRYPGYAPALAGLGAAYHECGNDEKAKDCWRRVVDIDPEDEIILRNLALLGN
jgi:tetratricopeptide (TPR) repeat protein